MAPRKEKTCCERRSPYPILASCTNATSSTILPTTRNWWRKRNDEMTSPTNTMSSEKITNLQGLKCA